ncbi:type IV pilin protein [Luteimonas deserti]|uniref:Type IV pilin protein n=1 Tax=Luteimonas deserti TaxID=2752306 RepID=A0A7Z0QQ18_9GAMM|nr:type IV pilin protein [Luteimonas deserti]
MTRALSTKATSLRALDARGFTLIELMVVVAVIAILAAIAYPSYQDSVRKSRRAQVKADMVEIAQRYERFHTINNTYVGFWQSAFGAANAQVPSPSTAGAALAYRITNAEAVNTFTLTAAPQGTQVKDTRCGTLGLSNTGAKTKTGSGTVADCW